MAAPPTIQTPPYRPTRPSAPLSPALVTPWTVPCHFGIPTFLHVLKDLTLHPERNSSLILRADPLPLETQSQIALDEKDEDGELGRWIERNGMEKVEEVRVRLMPKQPTRDGKLDQRVVFYRTPERVEHDHLPRVEDAEGGQEELAGDRDQAVVVMIPLVKKVEDIPFYHPPVRQVVFSYESATTSTDHLAESLDDVSLEDARDDGKPGREEPPIQGHLTISYLPFETGPPATTPRDPSETISPPYSGPLAEIRRTSLPRRRSPLAGPAPPNEAALAKQATREDSKVVQDRLERTCLALLERVYKHGFGSLVGYKKRVNHDVSPHCAIVAVLDPASADRPDGREARDVPGPLPRLERATPTPRLPCSQGREQ